MEAEDIANTIFYALILADKESDRYVFDAKGHTNPEKLTMQ